MEVTPGLLRYVRTARLPRPRAPATYRSLMIATSLHATAWSAMGKRAIGMYSRRFLRRMDTGVHVMDYGQRPAREHQDVGLMGCSEMVSPPTWSSRSHWRTTTGGRRVHRHVSSAAYVQRARTTRSSRRHCRRNPITGEEQF
jgi:hypothetical protein